MEPMLPPGSDTRRFNEDIGGRIATVWRNLFQGTYYVGAQWEAQSVWVVGESPDSDAADLMLSIARTVRFAVR